MQMLSAAAQTLHLLSPTSDPNASFIVYALALTLESDLRTS
jgi:hypothetical protein